MSMHCDIKTYSAEVSDRPSEKARNGLQVVISKSPTAYLKKLAAAGKCHEVAVLDNAMDIRYGSKTTPTTRRTTYDHENRKYY